MSIKYSVIMPCYNAESFIENTLHKFQNAMRQRDDVELVIVNDGSSDNTFEKIKKISFPNLKLITINNQGVSNARNVGMRSAIGEYIMFLDSDDYYDSCVFEHLDSVLSNTEILFFGYQTVSGDGEIKRNYSSCDLNGIDSHQALSYLFEKKLPVHICATVIRRDILESRNLLFNPNVHHCEDLEFIIKTLSSTALVTISSKILYNYVDQPSSAVNKIVDSKQLTKFDVFESSLPSYFSVESYKYYNYYVLSVYLLLMLKVLAKGVVNYSVANRINQFYVEQVRKKIIYPNDITALKIRVLVLFFRLAPFIKLFNCTKKIRDLHVFK